MSLTDEQIRASIEVLYEDDNVLVVNKPAGLSMHRISPTDHSKTLQGVFTDKLANNDPLRGGIVHRLDKDTSGVVMLAKNTSALEFLQAQFAARKVDKTYLALVWGHLKHPEARIELPLARSYKTPTAMAVRPGGKPSVSQYKVLAEPGPYSYLEIMLHTGRTHQIRVQFAHLGHPVVGDKMYGHKKAPAGLSRQFLHAQKLAIILPGNSEKTSFSAELADDLMEFLESVSG